MKHTTAWFGAFAALAAVAVAPRAGAVAYERGDFSLQFDTVVSLGASVRIQDRDDALVSIGNGGTGLSSNIDDGNLNYDRGEILYAPFQVNHDLNLSWGDYGAFVRAYYYYDPVNAEFDEPALRGRARNGEVVEAFAKDFRFLDWYVHGQWTLGEVPVSLRLGNQVVSWGESTFIQFGLNAINSYDLPKLRYPGSDLKNVFIPVPLAYAQAAVTDNLGLEAFVQLGNEPIALDPQGSPLGQVDGLSEGGEFLILESRFFEQNDVPDAYKIFRRPDIEADVAGQYGLALRLMVPQWNSAEIGAYAMNIHSNLPVTSGYSMSVSDWEQLNVIEGTGLQDPTGATGLLLVRGLLQPESLSQPQLDKLDQIHGLGGYALEYVEDIQVYGLSFNADTPFGVALQVEVSYRVDQPFQIDDYELVYHGLSPASQLAGPVGGPLFDLFFPPNQLGPNTTPGEYFAGYRRFDMAQAQLTGTYLFGPDNPFGAQQWIVLMELGYTRVIGLPEKSELRFEGPGTFQKGGTPGVSDDYYSGDFGWGYRLLSVLTYADFMGTDWQFSPVVTFFHDVNGTAAGPARSFIEDSMQLQLMAKFEYLGRWAVDLGWMSYFGIGDDYRNTNLVHDRDFVSASVRYSF